VQTILQTVSAVMSTVDFTHRRY